MTVRRVAVTGAGGFIGSVVCGTFVARGCDVRALVGPPSDRSPAPPGVTLALRAEIVDRDAVVALCTGVETVVHLAGPPSVRESFDDPQTFVRAHVEGTATVLAACRQSGVGHFVYVSSAEVYGRPRTDPVPESHPLEARSPYAAAKIGAEQLVRAYGHGFGISATILRPFSVYGPGMGAHAVLPAILRQLTRDGPVRLADLRPERDYCFVDDVADAIVLAAHTPLAEIAALNVGSGIGTSVAELACTLVRLSGRAREVEEDAANRRPGNADILRLVADRQLAYARLGWAPRVTLEEGLRRMIRATLACT